MQASEHDAINAVQKSTQMTIDGLLNATEFAFVEGSRVVGRSINILGKSVYQGAKNLLGYSHR
jgi:hypothetical protein